jgi:hypothetical protein
MVLLGSGLMTLYARARRRKVYRRFFEFFKSLKGFPDAPSWCWTDGPVSIIGEGPWRQPANYPERKRLKNKNPG